MEGAGSAEVWWEWGVGGMKAAGGEGGEVEDGDLLRSDGEGEGEGVKVAGGGGVEGEKGRMGTS